MRLVRMRTLLAIVVGACAVLAIPASASAAEPGSISGTVTNASTGEPLPFIEVCAYNEVTPAFGCDFSEFGTGEYEIPNLEAGSYNVEFNGEEGFFGGFFTQWYNGKATFAEADSVPVTEGEVTEGIDAAMQERGGKISGTVTDATNGAGIGGIEVCARGGEEFFGQCAITGSDGQYTLEHLLAGSYKVEFFSPFKFNSTLEKAELEGPNYVGQFYNGKAHEEEADAVTVSDGTTTSGINASMQPGATINGTVTDATSGNALQGIEVCAWGSTQFNCTQTDTAGNYSIPTLATGSYKIEFQPEFFFVKSSEFGKEHWRRTDFPLIDYLRQYWNEKFSFEAAEPVAVTGGQSVNSINARMTKEVQPPPPPGTAKVHGKVRVKGNKVLVPLQCGGPGDCAGTLKLTAKSVTPKKKTGKRNHKRAKTVVIGQKKFSIHGGTSAVVKVGLNAKGKALLAQAGGKGLKVKVGGTGLKAQSVTLKGKAPKKHKKHGKR